VVGKDKCRLAGDGRAHECIDPRHWSKPSLWKPGAEKICGMLGLIPRFPNLAEYEKTTLRGEDIKVIILKCELHTGSGFVAAEGTGARRVDQDRGDINKSLKMSMKSAHIDATLRVAGLSELFTQDMEDMLQDKAGKGDMPPGNGNGNHLSPPAQTQPTKMPPPPAKEPATNGQSHESNRITSKQHKFIMDLLKALLKTNNSASSMALSYSTIKNEYRFISCR
jgi:hypothetical protein